MQMKNRVVGLRIVALGRMRIVAAVVAGQIGRESIALVGTWKAM